MNEFVVALPLFVLALAHSVLGEQGILRPLFAASWKTEVTPRWAMESILRFAWHLTSLSWLALGAIALDASVMISIGLMGLGSAAIIFVMLRGHLAWPLFLLCGLAAFRAENLLPEQLLLGAAGASVVALSAIATLHIYWAFGGRWMLDNTLPRLSDSEAPQFVPGRLMTLAVAVALFVFAGLIALAAFERGPGPVVWLVWIGVAVFALRAVGDGKVAGFTKQIRDTRFATFDDRFFTPLVVFLAFGAAAAAIL